MSLADTRGRTVVLYFYPKDSTPGCTTETREFGDAAEAFAAAERGHLRRLARQPRVARSSFKAALGIPFELISDPDEALCALFGVMKMKNMYGKQVRGIERSTFVVDPAGVLVREWRGVQVPGHVAEVLGVRARRVTRTPGPGASLAFSRPSPHHRRHRAAPARAPRPSDPFRRFADSPPLIRKSRKADGPSAMQVATARRPSSFPAAATRSVRRSSCPSRARVLAGRPRP